MMKSLLFKSLGTAIASLLVWAFAPTTSAAAEELLVVVTEEVVSSTAPEEETPAATYWWSGSTPQWTATDVALQEAMRNEGSGFARPRNLSELSKIYRVAELSDSSALAMASVFGRRRVLVGRVRYAPTPLSPVGLSGWRGTVDLRLVERGEGGPTVRLKVDFRRARWGG